jgi:hypothetical protein
MCCLTDEPGRGKVSVAYLSNLRVLIRPLPDTGDDFRRMRRCMVRDSLA